jgi:hypothetical protein
MTRTTRKPDQPWLTPEQGTAIAEATFPKPAKPYVGTLIGNPWCGCNKAGARCLRHQGWRHAEDTP